MTQKDEYIAKLKSQLDEWSAEIGKLETRLEAAGEATAERLKPHLEAARKARDAAAAKLSELRDAGEASWESLQGEVEHVWKVVKQSVNYFKSQL